MLGDFFCLFLKMCRVWCEIVRLLYGEEGEQINEQEWLNSIRAGGTSRYKEFVQVYHEHVYRTAFAVLHHHQDAEDVTQEVFVQIYRALPEYRNQGLKTWITRITVNRAIDARRKIGRQREDIVEDTDQQHVSMINENHEPSIEDTLVAEERRAMIHQEINELPEQYQEIIHAFYMDEKSYEQISKETGLEKKSVESRLYRARLWMKRHWRKEDFE